MVWKKRSHTAGFVRAPADFWQRLRIIASLNITLTKNTWFHRDIPVSKGAKR